ncbi:MAG: methylmalonyl-CoA mutase family protein, partial [Pseudomonadota bacterium]
TDTVDPLAGSYYVESLTKELADKAWALMEEIEAAGGMTKAVQEGLPKRQIEEAAARKQAAVDRGDSVIVGVNKYRLEKEDEIDILDIDNTAVRIAQVARLKRVRSSRDQAACDAALARLAEIAKTGEGNLLGAAVEAARARASVGEISDAMETAFARYAGDVVTISGVYGAAYEGDERFESLKRRITSSGAARGRAPSIFVAKMGQDGHDRGAKVIATAFQDLGFEVHVGPLFQTPQEAADMAVAHDVDIVGVSSHAAGHKTLSPMLVKELAARDAADKIVICGGVIPQQDYEFLLENGVEAVFGPGTDVLKAAESLLDILDERERRRNYAGEAAE